MSQLRYASKLPLFYRSESIFLTFRRAGQRFAMIHHCGKSSGIDENPDFAEIVKILEAEGTDVCHDQNRFVQFYPCVQANREKWSKKHEEIMTSEADKCEKVSKVWTLTIEELNSCKFPTTTAELLYKRMVCHECDDERC